MGTPVSPTNKTDHHDITEMLLKVEFSTINSGKDLVTEYMGPRQTFGRYNSLVKENNTRKS